MMTFLLGVVFAVCLSEVWSFLSRRRKELRLNRITVRDACEDFERAGAHLVRLLGSGTRETSSHITLLQSLTEAYRRIRDCDLAGNKTNKAKKLVRAFSDTLQAKEVSTRALDELTGELNRTCRLLKSHYELKKVPAPQGSIDHETVEVVLPASERGESYLFGYSLGIGSLAVGGIYLSVFIRLAIRSANALGIPVSDLLMFTWSPGRATPGILDHVYPHWSSPAVRPLVWGLGVLWGALCVVVPLILILIHSARPFHVMVKTIGVVQGLFLTVWLGKVILGLPIAFGLIYPRLAYVVLAFYVCESLKILSVRRELRRIKYEQLLDGLFAIAATAILIRTFGNEIEAVASGPLFLLCVFVSMLLVEEIQLRLIYAGATSMPTMAKAIDKHLKRSSRAVAAPQTYSIVRRFWNDARFVVTTAAPPIWKQFKAYRGQDVVLRFEPVDGWKTLKLLTSEEEFWKMSIAVFVLFLVWPLLLGGVYKLLIEHIF